MDHLFKMSNISNRDHFDFLFKFIEEDDGDIAPLVAQIFEILKEKKNTEWGYHCANLERIKNQAILKEKRRQVKSVNIADKMIEMIIRFNELIVLRKEIEDTDILIENGVILINKRLLRSDQMIYQWEPSNLDYLTKDEKQTYSNYERMYLMTPKPDQLHKLLFKELTTSCVLEQYDIKVDKDILKKYAQNN